MLGLFEHPMPDVKYQQTVRSEEHLALAREAVSKSLVLLINQNDALPLDKNTGTIFLTGSAADNIGMQNGGWTLQWQGQVGNDTEGTSIYEALQAAVGPDTTLVYDSEALFKDQTQKADVGIVVIGEKPYAEGQGDSNKLLLPFKDVDAVSKMREHANKVVVIVVSGRPVNLNGILPYADAIVAAWWFGTEGAGVADVLFGDQPFTGKLPYTWPRTADQLPLNSNNIGERTGCEGPLFPFGYGLMYGEPGPALLECK
jgi:beta-glucosidase